MPELTAGAERSLRLSQRISHFTPGVGKQESGGRESESKIDSRPLSPVSWLLTPVPVPWLLSSWLLAPDSWLP